MRSTRSAWTQRCGAWRPDIVHLHRRCAGTPIAGRTGILLCEPHDDVWWHDAAVAARRLRSGGLKAALQSNVLRPRVAATTVVPSALVRRALRRAGTHTVLHPGPAGTGQVARHGRSSAGLWRAGGIRGGRTFQQRAGGSLRRPRGIRARDRHAARLFPAGAQAAVPDARLRLLLIPRPELDGLLARRMPPDWETTSMW